MNQKPPSVLPTDRRGRRYFIAVFVAFLLALVGALIWANGLMVSPREGELNSERAAGGKDLKPQSFQPEALRRSGFGQFRCACGSSDEPQSKQAPSKVSPRRERR